MTDQHAFPQDWATGLQEEVDWNDAGAFANHADHPNLRDYVESGFGFDVDFVDGILRVEPGKAFLWQESTFTNDHRADGGPNEKELQGGIFVAQNSSSGDLTLVDGEINYVYVHIDQQENDGTYFWTNTTDTPPPEPYLRLGYVDVPNETYVEENRYPTVEANRLRVTGRTFGGDW